MKYVNALRDANDLEKYKEAVKDLDVPSQGGFMSNNKFTNFLKNLVGGSGLGVRINLPGNITPANFAQVKRLVDEGRVPQWFENEYNAYTARPPPDPTKPRY